MKLTKTVVDKLSSPASGQKFYRDDALKGFAVRVTARGAKAFVVEKRVNGSVRRITLAKYPELTVEQARKKAQQLLGKIASGEDPIAEKKKQRAKAVTLETVFEDYLGIRDLKPGTVFDYQRVLREAFPDWRDKPITAITRDMVSSRHAELGKASEARANNAMRVLRALFNFAEAQYDDGRGNAVFHDNPVKRLSQTRAWYRVERRKSVIKTTDFPGWMQAVRTLGDEDPNSPGSVTRDYLLTLVFTGLRREEALQLTWDSVDFDERTLTIADTKNREVHTLPLSDFLVELLRARKLWAESEYVFPGKGPKGHVVEFRRYTKEVRDQSDVSFTPHDLRRTFITVAESLDISVYAVKRLANHKVSASDVTAGYIITDTERLRDPMQRITDRLLELSGDTQAP